MKSRRTPNRTSLSSDGVSSDETSSIHTPSAAKRLLEEQTEIRSTRHPLEISGLINGKTISIAQRAMICCINRSQGMASETIVLRFLQKHWAFIKKNSAKDYRDAANRRVVKINLHTKKNGQRLFIEVPRGSGVWSLTPGPASADARVARFDDKVLEILQESKDGMTLDELAEATQDFRGVEGFCKDLIGIDPTGWRRLRALMLVKRRTGHVEYLSDSERWRATLDGDWEDEDKSSEVPEYLQRTKISEITLAELYKMMKRNVVV